MATNSERRRRRIMGLLAKIFSSSDSQSTVVDTDDVSDVSTAKYKEKYLQMEAEGKRIS